MNNDNNNMNNNNNSIIVMIITPAGRGDQRQRPLPRLGEVLEDRPI